MTRGRHWDPSPNPKFWDWDWDWDRFCIITILLLLIKIIYKEIIVSQCAILIIMVDMALES